MDFSWLTLPHIKAMFAGLSHQSMYFKLVLIDSDYKKTEREILKWALTKFKMGVSLFPHVQHEKIGYLYE